MSSSLRSIVKKQQQELVLKDFLGDSFSTTSDEDKQRFLNAVDDSVEREVTIILNAFVDEALKGSPEAKRRRNRAILNLVATIICTPGIAYGVNLTNWLLVGLFSLLLLAVQIYNIVNEF